jgi:hypothetical protein
LRTQFAVTSAFITAVIAAAIGLGGCWMAAAPLASSVLGMAGSVGSSTPIRQANKDTAQDIECDLTNPALPFLVELRTDKVGTTIYRPLSLTGPQLDLQYQDVTLAASAGGWKMANNFAKFHFQPPLQSELAAPSTTYLAYAPADAQNPLERRQSALLQHDFGPIVGTFKWNGRLYQYALAHQLPCASSHAESEPTALHSSGAPMR